MEENNPIIQNDQIQTKFNWGALFLAIPFSVAHKAWLGLLTLTSFIPFIGWIFSIVWVIIFGMKGEEWALKNNTYRDEEEFRKIMNTWNRAGIAMAIVFAVSFILALIFLGSIMALAFATFY